MASIFQKLRVVDGFMQNSHWMGLVGDMTIPAEMDTLLRATAARNKARLWMNLPFICPKKFQLSSLLLKCVKKCAGASGKGGHNRMGGLHQIWGGHPKRHQQGWWLV